MHGHGVLTWEWLLGYRSWALPMAHVPLVFLGSLLGIHGGLALTTLARCAYAVADVWALRRFTRFAFERAPFSSEARRERAESLCLATLMLLPTVALWGVSTLQDHLASVLFYLSIPTVFRALESGRARRWLIAGALVAAPALVKLPMAVASVTLALTALVRFRAQLRWPLVAALSTGGLAVAALSSLLDLATVGSLGATTIHQLFYGESLSRTYGTSPPWAYVTALPSLIGYDGCALAAALVVVQLAHVFKRAPVVAARATLTPVALVAPAMIALAAALSAIAHKEPRFVLPVIPLVFVALFSERTAAVLDRERPRPALLGALAAGVLVYSTVTASAQRIELSDSDVSRIEEAIRVRARTREGPVAICLWGEHWSQMRGSLGISAPVRYEDVAAYPSPERALARCEYAIVRDSALASFRVASDGAFIATGVTQNRCTLFALRGAQSLAPASSQGMLIRGPSRSHR